MPLQFIPQSDDPFLTSDAAMSLAKFGHLNFLLTQINDTEYADQAAAEAALAAPGDLYHDADGKVCVVLPY